MGTSSTGSKIPLATIWRASYFQSFGESLAIADAEMKKSFEAPDFGEGVKSFMERRPPAFPAV